jgi:hypothetical protein
MSALATVQVPFSWQPAVELGNRQWAKKVLPVGSVEYQGRTLRFDREYLQGLADSFHDQAYDQVPLQLADSSNRHTNDPERTAGWIDDLEVRHDGLYALATVTERGERVLSENPMLGVSCRIVEQYNRSDGRHYPAAVQHVLATLDPRIPQLGAWAAVEMSNEDGGLVIDLSQSTFPGDAPPDAGYELSDDELEQLASELTDEDLAGLTEEDLTELIDGSGSGELTDEELSGLLDGLDDDGGSEFTDDELAAWVDSLSDADLAELEAEADADADGYGAETAGELAEYGAEFANHYAASQARQAARDSADEHDRRHPAVRTEDVLARALSRIGAGTYTSGAALASQQMATELSVQAGLCGPGDPVTGLCSARYHELTCSGHAPGSDGQVELANGGGYALEGLMLGLEDQHREDDGIVQIPPATIELAHQLNTEWGLHSGATSYAYGPEAGDLFSQPYQGDAYAAMAAELGRDDLVAPEPEYTGYPAVSELARELGLR